MTAQVRTLSIRGPFLKSTLNGGLKKAIYPNFTSIRSCRARQHYVHCPTCEATESPVLLINWCPLCMYFSCCMLYSYHLYLVLGMLLRLVGLKECGLGTQSLGMGWPLSEVGTQVGLGEDLLQSSTLHKSGMASWYRYREHYTTHYHIVS